MRHTPFAQKINKSEYLISYYKQMLQTAQQEGIQLQRFYAPLRCQPQVLAQLNLVNFTRTGDG